MTIIAKYKFNNTLEANLLPEFNSEFTGYTVTDEVNGEVTTRTIESDSLPTLMRFGSNLETYVEGSELALLEVLDMNTSRLTSCYRMFRYCKNLTSIICNWDTSDVTTMYHMFYGCIKLTTLDISNFNTSNVTNMGTMFYKCNNLTTLDMSNFNTSKVTNTTNMFNNTPLLTDIGMIYCDIDTINKLGTLTEATLYIDENIDQTQYTGTAPLKVYKETTKEYTLTSPLLEGDRLEEINGKVYHYHKMNKVVLDGSEDWMQYASGDITSVFCLKTWKGKLAEGVNLYCDKFLSRYGSWNIDSKQEGIQVDADIALVIQIDNSKPPTTDVVGFKQWLQANPITVVYELAEPYYELISEEPYLIDYHKDGKILIDTTVPQEVIEFEPLKIACNYLYTNKTYTVQFISDRVSVATITLGGNSFTQSITKGLNKVTLATPSTLTDNLLIINGTTAVIEDIVITDTTDNYDYFEGLQSSFESGLVTDENDENYGKYKVEVKVTGKNKFNGELEYGRYNYINGIKDANDSTSYMRFPKLIPIKNGSVRATVFGIDGDVWFVVYNTNGGYIDFGKAYDLSRFDGRVGYISFYMVQPSFADNWYIQIEEGTQATSYEPYKESIHTLYLNSPLLKGDKLVVHEGKLCHYHKMGMVVLDGSEDEGWILAKNDGNQILTSKFILNNVRDLPNSTKNIFSDKFRTAKSSSDFNQNDTELIYGISIINLRIMNSKLSTPDVNGFKQWLQANPTTIVYELAEPYYEEIEPAQEIVMTVFNESDLSLNAVIPPTTNITYSTNITSVTAVGEELQATQIVQNEQDAMIIDNAVNIAMMQLTL